MSATHKAPTDAPTDRPGGVPRLPQLVWSLRRSGRAVAQSDPNLTDPDACLEALRAGPARQGDVYVVSSLEWSEQLPRETWTAQLNRDHLGLLAFAFVTENRTELITPERSIACNQAPHDALQTFLQQGTGGRQFDLHSARATTRIVQIGQPPREAELHRGTSLVALAPEPDENRAFAIAAGIADWMTRNLSASGELPYFWHTSDERPDRHSDNAIRRFLGAIGLGKFAATQPDARLNATYHLNLAHLLDRYLEPLGDGLAIIAEHPAANLGASALGGLAILAGPEKSRDHRALAMLLRAIQSMTNDRSGFRTHFYPADRDGNPRDWAFYSGEALLFLAESKRLGIAEAPDLTELLVLYRRCRERWRQDRHVAMVSWHCQAATSLYHLAPCRELAEFVFELNDWLIDLQPQVAAEPDRLGEFGDPLRPQHGMPHASATAVYLEGLADARDIARAVGDHGREQRYETAIALALRSLRQLQFRDWRCTWYLERPERVLGALRCNAHDNTIRIDNCGHALAGLAKLLAPADLPPPTDATHTPQAAGTPAT